MSSKIMFGEGYGDGWDPGSESCAHFHERIDVGGAVCPSVQRVEGCGHDGNRIRSRRPLVLVGCPVISQDRSARTIPAPAVVLEHLREHRTRQLAERLRAGQRWRDSGLVFTSTIGTPLEPRNVDRAWHEARVRVDLGWVRLHDLRHTCATFMLLTGASPQTVMETLGHSQITLTMNTYAHVLPQAEREALDQAARALFGEASGGA